MEGRVRAALRLLSSDSHTGLQRLDQTIDTSGKTVRDVLEDKHPDPKPAHPEEMQLTVFIRSYLKALQQIQFGLLPFILRLLPIQRWRGSGGGGIC